MQEKKKILVSNDDGIDAPGLVELVKEVNQDKIFYFTFFCGSFLTGGKNINNIIVSFKKQV